VPVPNEATKAGLRKTILLLAVPWSKTDSFHFSVTQSHGKAEKQVLLEGVCSRLSATRNMGGGGGDFRGVGGEVGKAHCSCFALLYGMWVLGGGGGSAR